VEDERAYRIDVAAAASAREGVAVGLISLMFKYRILSLFRNM
jgi:hypothetical protein